MRSPTDAFTETSSSCDARRISANLLGQSDQVNSCQTAGRFHESPTAAGRVVSKANARRSAGGQVLSTISTHWKNLRTPSLLPAGVSESRPSPALGRAKLPHV